MRKLLVLSFMILISTGLFAQFSFGPRIGLGLNQVKVEDYNLPGNMELGKINFQAGLFLRYDLSKYFVQITPSYLNKGKLRLYASSEEWLSPDIQKISFPITVGLRSISGLRLSVGWGFEFAFWDEENIDIEGATKEALTGTPGSDYMELEGELMFLQAGVGFDISRFTLGLYYQIQFWNDGYINYENDYTISMLNFTVAYRLEL